jgi:hypothetical protein
MNISTAVFIQQKEHRGYLLFVMILVLTENVIITELPWAVIHH